MLCSTLLLSIAALNSSNTCTDCDGFTETMDIIVSGKSRLPSLKAVLAAVDEQVEVISATKTEAWAKRARRRGWFPQFSIRFGTDTDQAIRYESYEFAGRLSQTQNLELQLSLVWSLSELSYSSDELRAFQLRLKQHQLVQSIKERVAQVYYERAALELRRTHINQAEFRKQMLPLDAELFAKTGGFYRVRS